MEVALAATVLALTLVGMIGVIESGSATLDLSRKQTVAGQILHEEIDNLRVQSWSTITAYPAGPTPLSAIRAPGTPVGTVYDPNLETFWQHLEGNHTYQFPSLPVANLPFPYVLTRTVSPIEPLLLQVTFTIKWTGLTGQRYSRSSTTYVTQNGLNLSYQRS
jgi:hypothetical protein